MWQRLGSQWLIRAAALLASGVITEARSLATKRVIPCSRTIWTPV